MTGALIPSEILNNSSVHEVNIFNAKYQFICEEKPMSCAIDQSIIESTIDFHGHSCPGLAIGIRAAELGLREMEGTAKGDLIAVVETDMCGVDAIQFLTGCTFGKGNLIHRDFGKMAFSFYDRQAGQGIRILLRPGAREHGPEGGTTQEKRDYLKERLMTQPLDELFTIDHLQTGPPRSARVLESLPCADCGEATMESRTRRFAGQTLCISCFAKVEQKI